MKKITALSLFILTIGLGGCATPNGNTTWYKEGATDEQFRRDTMSCRQYGMQSAQTNGMSGNMFVEIWIQNEANDCLRKLGYSQSKPTNSRMDRLTEERKEIDKIGRENCAKPELKEYYSKTACFSIDITLEQMADGTKITNIQKPILLKARGIADDLTNSDLKLLKEFGGNNGNKLAAIYESLKPQSEKNTLDLYNGKITWGEYNRRRKEISSDIATEMRKQGIN